MKYATIKNAIVNNAVQQDVSERHRSEEVFNG